MFEAMVNEDKIQKLEKRVVDLERENNNIRKAINDTRAAVDIVIRSLDRLGEIVDLIQQRPWS